MKKNIDVSLGSSVTSLFRHCVDYFSQTFFK
jgi:hypothetical protein